MAGDSSRANVTVAFPSADHRRAGALRPRASVDAENVALPLDRARIETLHDDRVEAAGRLVPDHRQVAVGGTDEPRALGGRDAANRTAEALRAAQPHFDEDQDAAVASDD